MTCANDPHGSLGFCLLNNLAIGAAYAVSMYRAKGMPHPLVKALFLLAAPLKSTWLVCGLQHNLCDWAQNARSECLT